MCTILRTSDGRAQCQFVSTVSGSQIASQGLGDYDTGATDGAITGGSGAYKTARGQFSSVNVDDDTYKLTFQITG